MFLIFYSRDLFERVFEVKIKRNNLGLAGEFMVAGKLLRMNYDASITFGLTKRLDIIYHDPKTGKTGQVQVKSAQQNVKNILKNGFTILTASYNELKQRGKELVGNLLYVCVFFASNGTERYFVVPPEDVLRILLRRNEEYYAKGGTQNKDARFPHILYVGDILEYENRWDLL